jgi:predicted ATPase with chaperone activity
MAATDQINADLNHTVFLGELSLHGGLRHTTGVLSMYLKNTHRHTHWRTPTRPT